MNKGNLLKKILLGVLIASFVAGSITFTIWNRLKTTELELKYEEVEGELHVNKYYSTSADRALVIPDTAVNEDGETLPITALGEFSVSNSGYLEELFIGANIKAIHAWAITNCERLSKITVDENNPYFTSKDGVLYNKDMSVLLCYPNMCFYEFECDENGAIKRDSNNVRIAEKNEHNGVFALPDSINTIGENAFYKCSKLTKIEFTENLRDIKEKAFFKCKGLKSIELKEGIKNIGVDAFAFCDNAEGEIRIPSSCEKIGKYAFFSNSSLVSQVLIEAPEGHILLDESWLPNKKGTNGKPVAFSYTVKSEGVQ